MSLEGGRISTWDQMQKAFNTKYKDYCKERDKMKYIFIMTQGQDESLEDFEEIFRLSYMRANCTLDPESMKLVLV